MAKEQPGQARAEGFHPVPHTTDDTARLLADPKVKAAYDSLEDEYTALRAILSARREAGLTQAQMPPRAVKSW